jgi:hypothetical protein
MGPFPFACGPGQRSAPVPPQKILFSPAQTGSAGAEGADTQNSSVNEKSRQDPTPPIWGPLDLCLGVCLSYFYPTSFVKFSFSEPSKYGEARAWLQHGFLLLMSHPDIVLDDGYSLIALNNRSASMLIGQTV